jgi:hypothetical protein
MDVLDPRNNLLEKFAGLSLWQPIRRKFSDFWERRLQDF